MTKLEELEKELRVHWENTKGEREKTHSGALYEKFLKKKNIMTKKRIKI